MSLLDNLPHECTIRRRVMTQGTMPKGKPSYVDEQVGVECWEQSAGSSGSRDFQKKGMNVPHKVYFFEDPGITSRHQILVTKRMGVAVASPDVLDVVSSDGPDDSAGLGILWSVSCTRSPSAED